MLRHLLREHASASRAGKLKLGNAQPFSFEALKQEAIRLVTQPYRKPATPAPEITASINYDARGQIRFNTDAALYVYAKQRFPIVFFSREQSRQYP